MLGIGVNAALDLALLPEELRGVAGTLGLDAARAAAGARASCCARSRPAWPSRRTPTLAALRERDALLGRPVRWEGGAGTGRRDRRRRRAAGAPRGRHAARRSPRARCTWAALWVAGATAREPRRLRRARGRMDRSTRQPLDVPPRPHGARCRRRISRRFREAYGATPYSYDDAAHRAGQGAAAARRYERHRGLLRGRLREPRLLLARASPSAAARPRAPPRPRPQDMAVVPPPGHRSCPSAAPGAGSGSTALQGRPPRVDREPRHQPCARDRRRSRRRARLLPRHPRPDRPQRGRERGTALDHAPDRQPARDPDRALAAARGPLAQDGDAIAGAARQGRAGHGPVPHRRPRTTFEQVASADGDAVLSEPRGSVLAASATPPCATSRRQPPADRAGQRWR